VLREDRDGDQGVSAFLMLVDPETLVLTWANGTVEAVAQERGGHAAGCDLAEVIPYATALNLPQLIKDVAESGQARSLCSLGVSVEGYQTRTDASLYRMPSGDVLIATEYVVAGPEVASPAR